MTKKTIRAFNEDPHRYHWELPPMPTMAQILTKVEAHVNADITLVTSSCGAYLLNDEEIHVNLNPKLIVEDGFAKWIVEHEHKKDQRDDILVSERRPTNLTSVTISFDDYQREFFTPFPQKAEELKALVNEIEKLKETLHYRLYSMKFEHEKGDL
jgi:hypothetical protein